MNDHLRGFIIRGQNYRESDQLVTLFNEDGCHSLIFKSFFKPGNKQQSFGQLFTYVDLIVDLKPGSIMRVKNGKCVQSYYEQRQQHQWIKYMTIAAELVRYIQDEEEFHSLFPLFKVLADSEHVYASFLFFMKTLLDCQGLQPQINSCVHCGSLQVDGFSIVEGGFVCKEYISKRSISSDISDENRMKLLRYLFIADKQQFSKIMNYFKESDRVAQILVEYYQYHAGITLKSFEFYKNVL